MVLVVAGVEIGSKSEAMSVDLVLEFVGEEGGVLFPFKVL